MGILDAPQRPSTRELAYAEYLDASSTTNVTFTNIDNGLGSAPPIPGLSVTFTLTATTMVSLTAGIPGMSTSTVGAGGVLQIRDTTNTVVDLAWYTVAAANQIVPVTVRARRKRLTPGTYTFFATYGVLFINSGITTALKCNLSPAWMRAEAI